MDDKLSKFVYILTKLNYSPLQGAGAGLQPPVEADLWPGLAARPLTWREAV